MSSSGLAALLRAPVFGANAVIAVFMTSNIVSLVSDFRRDPPLFEVVPDRMFSNILSFGQASAVAFPLPIDHC